MIAAAVSSYSTGQDLLKLIEARKMGPPSQHFCLWQQVMIRVVPSLQNEAPIASSCVSGL